MNVTFLTIQSRGTLALPPDLRRRHGLDEPGTQVEVVEREDGVIELRPIVPLPRSNVVVLDEGDSRFFAEQIVGRTDRAGTRARPRRSRGRSAKAPGRE